MPSLSRSLIFNCKSEESLSLEPLNLLTSMIVKKCRQNENRPSKRKVRRNNPVAGNHMIWSGTEWECIQWKRIAAQCLTNGLTTTATNICSEFLVRRNFPRRDKLTRLINSKMSKNNARYTIKKPLGGGLNQQSMPKVKNWLMSQSWLSLSLFFSSFSFSPDRDLFRFIKLSQPPAIFPISLSTSLLSYACSRSRNIFQCMYMSVSSSLFSFSLCSNPSPPPPNCFSCPSFFSLTQMSLKFLSLFFFCYIVLFSLSGSCWALLVSALIIFYSFSFVSSEFLSALQVMEVGNAKD